MNNELTKENYMKISKFITLVAAVTMMSASASAFWFGNGSNNNGPYKVFKYSTSVTCDALQEMVQDEGALVVWESANPAIYNVRVAHGGYCPSGDVAKLDYVEAKDGKCMLSECVAHQGGDN
jgi:hypothetical protein